MSKVREAAIVHFPLLTIKGDFFSDREKTHLRILKGSLKKKREKKGISTTYIIISNTCIVLSNIVLILCIVHSCCKASDPKYIYLSIDFFLTDRQTDRPTD